MYVLNFLDKKEIEKHIDPIAYNVISYLLKKVAFSQPEVMDYSEISGIQITKEFLEDWIAQACGLEKIGAGNYPIDVYSIEKEFGADVKFMTCKTTSDGTLSKSLSNETSLAQNFKGAGKDLDQLFEKEDFEKILALWISLLIEKIKRPMVEFNLNKIYYFIFLRAQNRILLSIAELDAKQIKKLTVTSGTKTSVFIGNFLPNEFGGVKIYKSKKRMELRVSASKLENKQKTICWNFKDLNPDIISLRDVADAENIRIHAEKEFKRFFN